MEQESVRTKHKHNVAETYKGNGLRFLHMANAAKSRGTNDTREAPMVIIVYPNNLPDHYNSQLHRHVMNKKITEGDRDIDRLWTSQHKDID